LEIDVIRKRKGRATATLPLLISRPTIKLFLESPHTCQANKAKPKKKHGDGFRYGPNWAITVMILPRDYVVIFKSGPCTCCKSHVSCIASY
jgi:hypothetical protein